VASAGPLPALSGLLVVLARRSSVVLADAALLQALTLAALTVTAVVARVPSVLAAGLLMLPGVLVVAVALTPILVRPPVATGLLVTVGLPAAGAVAVVSPRVSGVVDLLAAVLALKAVRVLPVLLLTAVGAVYPARVLVAFLLTALEPATALTTLVATAVTLPTDLERTVLTAPVLPASAAAEALPVAAVPSPAVLPAVLAAGSVATAAEGALLVVLGLLLLALSATAVLLAAVPPLVPSAPVPAPLSDAAFAVRALLSGVVLVSASLSVALSPGSGLAGRPVLVRFAVAPAAFLMLVVRHSSSLASPRRRINRSDCSVPFHCRGQFVDGKRPVMPPRSAFVASTTMPLGAVTAARPTRKPLWRLGRRYPLGARGGVRRRQGIRSRAVSVDRRGSRRTR
jgi:hypothetical protein